MLTKPEQDILEELFTFGACDRQRYDADVLTALKRRLMIRDLSPNKIGITPIGQQALHPDVPPPVDKEGLTRREQKAEMKAADFEPLADHQRALLDTLAEAGGEMENNQVDGRTAASLERRGLVARDAQVTKLTPAGRARLSKPAVKPPFVKPTVPSVPPASSAIAHYQPATVTPVASSVPISITPEMDEDAVKARVLDMLIEQSPSVREFYDAVTATERALSRLKGV